MENKFIGKLHVEYIDGVNWKIINKNNDFYFSYNGLIIIPPNGFVTDFASVPRIFWSIFPPTGRYLPAAVIHDHLYASKNVSSKEFADNVFYSAMKSVGVKWIKRRVMYLAVKWFGKKP